MKNFSASHLAQRLLDAVLGHKAKKGRLFKLHGKSLAERAVEDGIAGGVCEVREDDRVFIRECMRLAGEKQPTADGQSDH